MVGQMVATYKSWISVFAFHFTNSLSFRKKREKLTKGLKKQANNMHAEREKLGKLQRRLIYF